MVLTSRTSSKKLPRLADKDFDPVTFDVLLVKPDDFATQIALNDLTAFRKIAPDELSSCGWMRREKRRLAPNVVRFGERFNAVCLWAQREVIAPEAVERRALVLAHFIRTAKKLLRLKDLHSTFAIVSALQSSAVHRLIDTWKLLPRKIRKLFDKMEKIFASDDNWANLRGFTDTRSLPCLYLTDLTHVYTGCSGTNGVDADLRDRKMNNIIRMISHFQDSVYDLRPIRCIHEYLLSIEFHSELTNIVEEDLYRRSLTREPPTPPRPRANSLELIDSKEQVKCKAKHRRTQSLALGLLSGIRSPTTPRTVTTAAGNSQPSSTVTDLSAWTAVGQPEESHEDNICNPSVAYTNNNNWIQRFVPYIDQTHNADEEDRLNLLTVQSAAPIVYAGPLKLSVMRRKFSRPARLVDRYSIRNDFAELRGHVLYLFRPRSIAFLFPLFRFNGSNERHQFKNTAYKSLTLKEWKILWVKSAAMALEIHHPATGRIYRIDCASRSTAVEWYRQLSLASGSSPSAGNLIEF